MKRLLITSTDLMMIQFLIPHVQYLSENGFCVDIACSDVGGRMEEVKNVLRPFTGTIHTVRLERSPVNIKNLLGYRDMRRLLSENQYDIIWTNEPVMGVITRLAAQHTRKRGTKVVYMCHGFHFFKGASAFNWMVFYPIERFMSRFCDMIVTVNREDEARAREFPVPRTAYIHGIGMNTQRLQQQESALPIRQELAIPENAFVLLSVGELNKNKNHETILHALSRIQDPSVHYIVCGKGALRDHLHNIAQKLNLSHTVHFLGYRTDVPAICRQSDVFLLPSFREGLSVASLEAMYCGLPLITSKVRGSGDYLRDGISGFLRDANDVDGFADAICAIRDNPTLKEQFSTHNRESVIPYCMENVQREIHEILLSL